MKKHIILIHGRDFKPSESKIKKNWIDALRFGLEREDRAKLQAFDNAKISFVYYGKESNQFLREIGREYDESKDVRDRGKCLRLLKKYKSDDFNRKNYEQVPGKTLLKEALADAFGGVLSLLNLSETLISSVAPEMEWYWNGESQFGSDLRWKLTEVLSEALREDEDIVLISHSLGTMISYDVLWKFSYYGEYKNIRDKKLNLWVTLGSPLGDETVKKNLKGATLNNKRRYPSNIKKWVNISAEDDYICHDNFVENDYREMLTNNMIDFIIDQQIYNLSVRNGKSNPHHGVGYLISPIMSKTLAEWL